MRGDLHSRACVLEAPGSMGWREGPLRDPGPREVLVETTWTALSPGTELAHYRGQIQSSHPIDYPVMTGYQSLGVVRACGEAVERVDVGDRVVATYGHRSLAILPERRVVPLPAGVRDELALLTILTGDAARGVFRLRGDGDHPFLVVGAGAMGLLCAWVLRTLGAPRVVVVEPRARRRSLAVACGAERALSPAEARRLHGEYPAILECSGTREGLAVALRAAAPRGHVAVVSDGHGAVPAELTPDFHEKELLLIGCDSCPDYAQHGRWYFEAVRSDPEPLLRLFERTEPATRIPEVVSELAEAEDPPLLVRFDWSG